MSETQLRIRRAEDRGRADHGWLHAHFTFSFGDYYDPEHMGFQALRVINNDTIEPGGGFPLHPHRDMEIFTYVIEGQLQHRDSLGNGSIIEAGNLQYMSAGSGIRHSEFNPSDSNVTKLYQIWLQPKTPGGQPAYAEKPLRAQVHQQALSLLFSADGQQGSTAIRQDANIWFGSLPSRQSITINTPSTLPHAWLQLITGELSVLDTSLKAGDGLQMTHAPRTIDVEGQAGSTFLLFQLSEQ